MADEMRAFPPIPHALWTICRNDPAASAVLHMLEVSGRGWTDATAVGMVAHLVKRNEMMFKECVRLKSIAIEPMLVPPKASP